MYVVARIGPWDHGEVRNGGLPDWVLKQGPTRVNDPVYLASVRAWYTARSALSSKACSGRTAARSSAFSLRTSTPSADQAQAKRTFWS